MHKMSPAALSPQMRLRAFVMRKMPRGIRKFSWWWDRMYAAIGGGGFDDDPEVDSRWPSGEMGPVTCHPSGFRVFLNLQSWSERRTYFSGEYYQRELQYLYQAILRRGDQYLDIGANIGMTALMGSHLIGPEGRGFAFEPNPEVFARLRRHFECNRITNIEAVPFALGDCEAEGSITTTRGSKNNSLLGTLTDVGDTGSNPRHQVRIVTGRPYLDKLDPARPTFVKIDVEGYEIKALRGMNDLLEWPEVAIFAEVNSPMLQRAGDSSEALLQLLASRGFQPFRHNLQVGRFGSFFSVEPAPSDHNLIPEDWEDFLFVKPESRFYHERIVPYLAANRSL